MRGFTETGFSWEGEEEVERDGKAYFVELWVGGGVSNILVEMGCGMERGGHI